ncbi:MAG: response regulator [Planctomycetes bacterium]|nr:response regulator [Planctomycetota bacterium]
MTRTVLIVDDSGVGRKLVRRCLEFAGLAGSEFLEAENGAKALELLEAGSVDVLVTDLNMPVMDGVELLRAITEIGTLDKLIRIVMTSTVSEALKKDLEAHRVAAYVTKPVSPTTFAKVLAPLLS